jgi:predicted phage terminase large subunit-like protein
MEFHQQKLPPKQDYYSQNLMLAAATKRVIERREANQDFRSFIGKVKRDFIFYPHCDLLADVLQRVANGEIKRLLVQLPPRHSKSEMVSRLFSSYYLKKNPSHFVGISSYSAELSYTLSRASRENYLESGGTVKDDVASVKHWETPQGGGVWSAGVGGSITGKGFHLGIIDDPIKNAEEASSDLIREKQREWYSSTFYTRAEPNAAIIIIQTRWHEADLTGFLLSEETGETPEGWHIVCLPALSDELPLFPGSCEIVEDFRAGYGLALCPERYDEIKLNQIRSRIGAYHFESLYQQSPTSKQGLFFDISKLEIVDVAPVDAVRWRGWDKAATESGGDFTAGVKIAKTPDGIIYIEDVVRGQFGTSRRDATIRHTALQDGLRVKVAGEIEPGSAGVESAENFIRLLSGFSVRTERATGSKELRADPFSSQLNAGNVKLVRGEWNKAFIDELRTFPKGKHDDQVDAASLAFNAANQPSKAWSTMPFRLV